MKPRILYRIVFDGGNEEVLRTLSVAERTIARDGKRIANVVVSTANGALSEERSDGWGSGSRAVAAERLRAMRARLIDQAERRWGTK